MKLWKPVPIDRIKTGMVKLDAMMGGGIPKGRIIEIAGYPHSGKTTLALEISKLFRKTLYVDLEHETDPDYHKAMLVNVDIVQPMIFEEVMDEFFGETIAAMNKKGGKAPYDLMIIDSIGSALTAEQYEKPLMDRTVGSLARAVTGWCRKAEKIHKNFGITTLVINHRKPAITSRGEYNPGGLQLTHSAGIILSIHGGRSDIWKDDGMIMHMKMPKNKVTGAIPLTECEYLIRRGRGISRGWEAFCIGEELGLIKQEGHHYKIGKHEFVGRHEMTEYLDDAPDVREVIAGKWREKMGAKE